MTTEAQTKTTPQLPPSDHAPAAYDGPSLDEVMAMRRQYLTPALASHGGYLCSAREKVKLETTLWPNAGPLNPKITARPIAKIAEMAGLSLPGGTTFIMVEGEETVEEDPYANEKLSPIIRLWTYGEFEEAIDYVERITRKCGYGHSCGIHSTSDENIMDLALKCHASRMIVCQPQCYANSGNYDNGMPFSMTLGCGTWGGNISSENIHWKHFLNTTWVSRPINPVLPDEAELFGEFLQP